MVKLMVMQKKYLARMLNTLLMVVVLFNASCSLMPRTVLGSDSSEVIESSVSSGKYKIHVYPIDATSVAQNSKTSYVYTIGRRDQLTIYVWGHPEFSSPLGASFTNDRSPFLINNSGQTDINDAYIAKQNIMDNGMNSYTVDEQGNIYIPLIGEVKLEGKTISQVRKELSIRLSKYVVDPQVSVRMTSFRSKLVYVLGEVMKPNAINLNDVPLDLAGLLSFAGWVNLDSADVKNIYILRLVSESDITVYRLDATSPTNLLFANGFLLKSEDIVFVTTAGVTQFNRIMSKFLTAAQSIWFTANIVPVGNKIIPD
jgi:protein involved in polysaccharide export with SLBB domain